MAGAVGLPHLVEALANSVVEAQDRIEQHQLALLRNYFDRDHRPKSAFMRLRSLSHQSDEDVQLSVPWLSLVKPNLLKIKDVQVEFEVGLTDFVAPPPAAPQAAANPDEPYPERPAAGTLQVDVGARPRAAGGATAKILMRVEAQEPTEGMSRMVGELVKRIMPRGE